MRIETATLDDVSELCDLLGYLFNQEAEFNANAETQAAGLRLIVQNPAVGFILVARQNDQLIGMVNVLFTVSTALGGRVAILEDMVVLPTKRGAGVGSALLTEAIALARKQGCQRITLLSDSDNKAAHLFYEKQGFHQSQMTAFRLLLT